MTSDANGKATLNQMPGGTSANGYSASGKMPIVVSGDGTTQVTFDLTVTDPPATNPPVTNPPVTNPPVGTVLTIIAGDKQSVRRGGSLLPVPGGTAPFSALTVQVTNAGKPVAGVNVIFKCGPGVPAAMACILSTAGGNIVGTYPGAPVSGSISVTTDANGMATLNLLGGYSAYATNTSGKMPIVVSGDGTNQVTFDLTVTDPPVTNPPVTNPPVTNPPVTDPPVTVLTIIAGDKQSVSRGGSLLPVPGGTAPFSALTVQVTNAGKPVAGVNVIFKCGPGLPAAMACILSMAGGNMVGTIQGMPLGGPLGGSISVTTDANGMATLNLLGGYSAYACNTSGKMPIVVSGPGTNQVTFDLTVLP